MIEEAFQGLLTTYKTLWGMFKTEQTVKEAKQMLSNPKTYIK